MESYSALVTQDGDVYTWGEGGSTWSPGPLGHGDYEDVWKPKKVEVCSDYLVSTTSRERDNFPLLWSMALSLLLISTLPLHHIYLGTILSYKTLLLLLL